VWIGNPKWPPPRKTNAEYIGRKIISRDKLDAKRMQSAM
jgi:hypothetical protein